MTDPAPAIDPRANVADIAVFDSPDLPAPLGHYSHVAVHAGLAYISGQLPLSREGVTLVDQPFEVQVRQVLSNLDHCLKTIGIDRARLVQVMVHVTDIDEWPTFDALYREWIGDHRPARAVAGANALHYGAAVEVHAVAAVNPAT
ncbi:RidA family protein [Nocardia sp. NBC_00508]|uniref:RidA family protein n=1 Tax=Nocardia sp. NBC_00508 TaxID=2975992 RepID=UPI002E811D62|nr:RidA family protein [Nocardia sp. NBC_00508]WUD68519.1 RidA family protein [Nocardia sp. NBC_00508]